MAVTTSPALPAFSYAQAAKGLAPTTTSSAQPQAGSSSNTSDSSSTEIKSLAPNSEKVESRQSPTIAARKDDRPGDVMLKIVRDETDFTSTAKSHSDKDSSTFAKQTFSSSSHPESKQISESTSSSLVASVATLPREDECSSTPNGSSESWDKQSEASAVAEKSVQTTESGKEKSADDDWVKVPEAKAEKELKAAPIPAVNIWQQRIEAQEAKAKTNAALRSLTTVSAPAKANPQTQTVRPVESQGQDEGTKRRTSGKLGEKGEISSKKKQTDETKTRDDGKRPPRQGRTSGSDKDLTEHSAAPPPAGDVASWPTPETANHEERKKAPSQDKGEKGDPKSPGMKPNQKWVPVPYVPTPKFSTPLPSTVSRRGGRPARGSREGGGRGGHASQSSIPGKTEKMRSMGPPPIPKQIPEQQRGRDERTPSGSRATSAPTQVRRASSVGPALGDQRRSVQATLSDRAPLETNKHTPGERQDSLAGTQLIGNEEAPTSNQSRAESRSFSRQSSSSLRTGAYDVARHSSGESHAHPRSFVGADRRNMYAEPERQNEAYARREQGESHRGALKTRDLDSKADSWRDREFIGDRSEQRSGRGRGGYRGRGNHPSAQSHQTHAFTAPLPQQPFQTGKANAYGERNRQSSTSYGGLPPQSNHRGSSRSQSIPTHGLYPGLTNSFSSPLSPIQTDVHGTYGGYPTMYPGIMSAIPYNAALEPMALMSMVSAQVEYYFSIENLCKDMYLRSHMDSQGWLPFSVIAGFNRIKSLTEDMTLIRHVCQMSRNIEFRPGEKGNDHLRKVDKWDQWVLDMDKRQPHAQNDGPPPLQQIQSPTHPSSVFPAMTQTGSPTWAHGPFYNGYGEAAGSNSVGPPSETQNASPSIAGNLPEIPTSEDFSLTNGQAELSPKQSADLPGPSDPAACDQNAATGNSIQMNHGAAVVHGHAPGSPQEIGVENVFCNDRMNELHVCVRHPTYQPQPPFVSLAARTFSHGSIDSPLSGGAHVVNPMSALRGGAGSPESFDHGQGRSMSSEHSRDGGDRGVFWMKDGAPPDSWNQEGSTVEKYQSLRDRALAERMPGTVTDDIDWLYQFWSHFLVRNFNLQMYNDFCSTAWEDAAAGHDGGLNHLSRYYGALLTGHRVLTEQLASDIVKLAEAEPKGKRQTFYKLRSAWRNGAFSFKSRKMIDKFVSRELKGELEK